MILADSGRSVRRAVAGLVEQVEVDHGCDGCFPLVLERAIIILDLENPWQQSGEGNIAQESLDLGDVPGVAVGVDDAVKGDGRLGRAVGVAPGIAAIVMPDHQFPDDEPVPLPGQVVQALRDALVGAIERLRAEVLGAAVGVRQGLLPESVGVVRIEIGILGAIEAPSRGGDRRFRTGRFDPFAGPAEQAIQVAVARTDAIPLLWAHPFVVELPERNALVVLEPTGDARDIVFEAALVGE